MTDRVAPDIVELMKDYFFARTDRIAFLAPWDKPHPTIQTDNLDELLSAHIHGDQGPKAVVHFTSRKGGHKVTKGWFRIGSYVPSPDKTTPWLCVDFDAGADHADALADPDEAVKRVFGIFIEHKLPVYLERSGGGQGWHLWCFFEPGIPASKVRRLALQLLPSDIPLENGGKAKPGKAKGIEVFPKQDKLNKDGLGNLVWLPWWSGAKGEGNKFFRIDEDGSFSAFVPDSFERIDEAALEKVLTTIAKPEARSTTRNTHPDTNNEWKNWRKEALAAVQLTDIYGDLLTGNTSGDGWLECRDPSSPSGDINPSAGVSDGTNSVERGSFHSFISGETISMFDFLVQHDHVPDMKGAVKRIAELSGVPTPSKPKQSTSRANDLPEIQMNQRQLLDIINDAWLAIRSLNEQKSAAYRIDPFLFRRGKFLVRLTRDDKDRPLIEGMDEAAVYGILIRTAKWVRATQEGEVDASPPKEVAKDLIAYPDKKLPVLESVTTSPVFTSQGILIRAPGYYPEEKLWYQPDDELGNLSVPDNPTEAEIAEARSLILDDLVVDFPFVKQSDRAHLLAAMVLPFVRRMIPGTTPIHLVEAPTQGSGKGLLCSLVSIVSTGSPLASRTLPIHEEEVRKMFTSELSMGRPIILLDNADDKKKLHSPSLASVITADVWTDRQLGRTAMLTLPNRAMWMLTGNNPKLSMELARRCVRIRIDPQVDRAWHRQEFKHEEVVEWATENRVRLTRAVLVLVQAWIAKGMPQTKFRLGSFERWSKIIGGILEVAGVPGFLSSLEDLYESATEDDKDWRDFIAKWWDALQQTPVKVSELNDLCEREELLIALRGDKSTRSQQTRLGKALGRYRDRVFDGVRLVKLNLHGSHKGGVCFMLQPVEHQQDENPSGQFQFKMGTLQENGDVVGTLQNQTSPGSNPTAAGVPEKDGDVGDVYHTPRAYDRMRAHSHAPENRSGSNVPNVPTNGRDCHQQRDSAMGTSSSNVPITSPNVPMGDDLDLNNLPF